MKDREPKLMPKYRTGNSIFKENHLLQSSLNDIDERLTAIEKRVFKTDKTPSTTRSQQMLLLHYLGVLDKLKEYNIPNTKIARFLSILMNASYDNIYDDLTAIHKPESHLKSSLNYNVITKVFKDSEMKNLAEETQKVLDNLMKSEK